jgi:hypothetical protein
MVAVALLALIALVPLASPETPSSHDVISGNVTFALMLEVNDRSNSASDGCGSYDINYLMEMMSVTWFLERVNARNYVNGVTIGKCVVTFA